MSDFSQWMYHQSQGDRLFSSQDDLDAAGPGWRDSPAAFGTPEPVVVKVEATPSAPSAVELLTEIQSPDPVKFIAPDYDEDEDENLESSTVSFSKTEESAPLEAPKQAPVKTQVALQGAKAKKTGKS